MNCVWVYYSDNHASEDSRNDPDGVSESDDDNEYDGDSDDDDDHDVIDVVDGIALTSTFQAFLSTSTY